MAKKIQLTKNGEDVYPITVPDSIAGLAQVAKTGSYNDLSDRPLPSPPEVFWATIGETSFSDIHSAALSGKLVVGIDEDSYCWLALYVGERDAAFQMFAEDGYANIKFVNSSGWTSLGERYLPFADDLEKVFIATYGSTTYGAIYEAFSDGKVVLVSRTRTGTTSYYQLSGLTSRGNTSYFEFVKVHCDDEDGFIYTVRITKSNVWTENSIEISIPTDLSDLDDDSTHRLVTDTEKATWNGKYTKPAGGIPASDLESGVIPSYGIADANNLGLVRVDKNAGGINKDSNGKLILDVASDAEIEAKTTVCALKVYQIDHAVKVGITTNTETLSSAEQAAAKSWLGVNDTPEIFWATYGTTTAAEIDAAVQAGKAVMCRYSDSDYVLSKAQAQDGYYYFGGILGSSFSWLRLQIDNTSWVSGLQGAQLVSNKVNSWQSTPDNNHYPSEKLVKDSIDAVDNVFFVTYGTTTYQQIVDAYAAGKVVVLFNADRFYVLSNVTTLNSVWFTASIGTELRRVRVTNEDQWIADALYPEVTGNKVTSWSATPNNTKYPSEKLVKDSIDAVDKIFWATYGTTTASEIDAALAAGKLVACAYNEFTYTIVNNTQTAILFGAAVATNNYYLRLVRSNDTWTNTIAYLQPSTERVNTISGNETANNRYPTAKATYDAIHPAIATTQPAGGFLPNIVYDLGTLSGNITFALATPADANVVNHYYWTFDTGSTAPTITWPTGLTWMGGSAPTINASKHYEISVLNGIGVAMEV